MRRKELIAASESAFTDGEITRAELFKIRIASLNPIVMKRIETAANEQAMFEGNAASVDWVKLFKELLPIILQLIALFA
jgi:hypothetical protein